MLSLLGVVCFDYMKLALKAIRCEGIPQVSYSLSQVSLNLAIDINDCVDAIFYIQEVSTRGRHMFSSASMIFKRPLSLHVEYSVLLERLFEVSTNIIMNMVRFGGCNW